VRGEVAGFAAAKLSAAKAARRGVAVPCLPRREDEAGPRHSCVVSVAAQPRHTAQRPPDAAGPQRLERTARGRDVCGRLEGRKMSCRCGCQIWEGSASTAARRARGGAAAHWPRQCRSARGLAQRRGRMANPPVMPPPRGRVSAAGHFPLPHVAPRHPRAPSPRVVGD
jgi:hypothetical protein